jgi:replicative DNA helicase
MESGIDGMLLKRRDVDENELGRAIEVMQEANWPLYLEDVRVSMADIRAHCLRHVAEQGPLALVIVDYLQLVKPASTKVPRAASQRNRALPQGVGDGAQLPGNRASAAESGDRGQKRPPADTGRSARE